MTYCSPLFSPSGAAPRGGRFWPRFRRLVLTTWPAWIACAGIGPCFGGPPLDVDDTDTAEPGHYELNTAYVSSQVTGSEEQDFPSVELNFGYSDNVELTLGLGAISVRNSGSRRATGLDDTTLEGKWRFQEERVHSPGIALDYQFKVPTASRSQGLGSGRPDHTLGLIVGKSLRRLTLLADGGFTVVGASDEENSRYYGIAGEYQATEKTNLGVDLFGSTPTDPGDRDELAWGVGVTHNFTPDRALLIGAGRSLHGLSDLNVYVGFQLVLGPENGTPDAAGQTPPSAPATPPGAGARKEKAR